MSQNNSGGRAGIGFCGILTIIFVVLKALGYITWSWWWVFAPLWIPAAFVAVLALVGIIIQLVEFIAERKKRNDR